MTLNVTRRGLLRSALAAPFIVQFAGLMPVKAAALDYLPGDHLSFNSGMFRETGFYAVSGHVKRVEGQHVVISDYYSPAGERRIHGKWTRLFHGLPGNRVDNPSQRHRLIRAPGRLGLAYPGDDILRAALDAA